MNLPTVSAFEESGDDFADADIERCHLEMAGLLERIAWSILRDWGLAADAVQETFALMAIKLGEIPAEQRKGWLVKTVQFQSQNIRRKQLRTRELTEQLLRSGLVRDATSEYRVEDRTVEQAEENQRLAEAIAGLPAAQRIIVKMRLAGEKSFAEIAEELALPLGTVLSRMRLALEKLRKRLES